MTRAEMNGKFGEDAATDIINRKTGDEELRSREVRPHPEAKDRKDCIDCMHASYNIDSTRKKSQGIPCTWKTGTHGCHRVKCSTRNENTK